MPLIDVQPLFLKDVTLTLALVGEAGSNEYQRHVDTCAFVPTPAPAASWNGLGRNTHTDSGYNETWVNNQAGVQDWDTDGSLSEFLLENAGKRANCTFAPNEGEPWYATITLQSPQIGGGGNAFAPFSVSMPSTKPSRVAPGA